LREAEGETPADGKGAAGSSKKIVASRVCPAWVGYLLSHPLRRLFQDPYRILSPYIRPGMRVLDIGPGMGFFSLPLAEMVGPEGKVICIDIQERMLRVLRRRAERKGLSGRIEARLNNEGSLDLSDLRESIDVALAFAVVHEIPDKTRLFSEVCEALRASGKVLLVEPKAHVSEAAFQETLVIAKGTCFDPQAWPQIRGSRSVLLGKRGQIGN
jgi:ubiquinone/menaquinone biosynthesis C-methylase UbiE